MIKTLVLSGGGVRGIAMVGALSVLRENQMLEHVQRVAGISAGSIIATFLVMSISESEMFKMIMNSNADNFRQSSVLNFLSSYGLDTGICIVDWLKKQFIEHGYAELITFGQLHKISGKELYIGATNVNTGEMRYFSHLNDRDTPVVHAIRMSCGLPFVMTLWNHLGHGYIDGAVVDNFPIQEFVKYANGDDQVLGILLSTDSQEYVQVKTFMDYVDRISDILMNSSNARALHHIPSGCMVLKLEVKKVGLVSVHEHVKKELFHSGVSLAKAFLNERA